MSHILTGEQLVNARIKSERELPVIGLKEFEPSNTWLQNRQIQSALFERKTLLEEERVEKWGCLSTAVWRPVQGKAELTRKTGKHWEVFGHHKENYDWLNPEEALFLMEMNCLEVLFEDVPMSIKRGYAILIDRKNGCSLNEYRVFQHLSRQGYRVFRHDPELTVTAYEKQIRLDKYVLDQKKNKEARSDAEISIVEYEKSNSLNQSTNSGDDECVIISEVSDDISVVHIDDSDDDIEVVFEKSATQGSEESSSESEEESDDSCSGNWKRQSECSVSTCNTPRSMPSARVNYVTIDEFLYDTDLVCQYSARSNVDEELSKFYNEIEVIDIDSEPNEKPFTVMQTRKDIMNSMQCLRDMDGNIVITRPDEHLLPPGVRPKFPLYRINLEDLKSETQKRPNYPRPFQRYTNYRNRYNSNWNAWGGHNNVNPMTQLQTMAHNMMQVASVVFNSINTTAPFHWQSRYQNQLRPISHLQSTPSYSTIAASNYRNRNPQKFNSISNPKQQSYASNFNPLGQNYNSGRSYNNFMPNYSSRFHPTNYNGNRFGFDSNRQHNPPPPVITEYLENSLNNVSTNSLSPVNRQIKSENSLRDIKHEPGTSSDPAYLREDIPVTTDDFIPINSSARLQSGENRVNVVDKSNIDSKQDIVIIEDDIINGFKRNGKRRANPNQRYFYMPKKQYLKNRKYFRKKFRRRFKSRDDVEVIDLDDCFPVKQEREVNEQNIVREINTSQDTNLLLVKTEKRAQNSDEDESNKKKIKTEKNIDNTSNLKAEITIKNEKNDTNDRQIVKGEIRINDNGIINSIETIRSTNIEENVEITKTKTEKPESKKKDSSDLSKETTSCCKVNDIKIEKPEVEKADPKQNKTNNIDIEPTKEGSESNVETPNENNLNHSVIETSLNEVPSTNFTIKTQNIHNEDENKVTSMQKEEDVNENNISEKEKVGQGRFDKEDEIVECEVQESVVDKEISNWSQLKETVSNFVSEEREEINVEEDDDDVLPLLRPQDCKTVGSVFSALQIFKPPSVMTVEDKIKISFDVYLPSGTFRKSSRGVPAYRIVVIGESDPVPSPGQILELNKRFADNVTVVLAVVMPDSVAYYSLSSVSLPVQQYNF